MPISPPQPYSYLGARGTYLPIDSNEALHCSPEAMYSRAAFGIILVDMFK
jgi:hypothetical protein